MLKLLMVYLYYHQKMTLIKRKARTIPYGYRLSENTDYIEPVAEELNALDEAKEYLNNCSYREVARWLERKTGRSRSHTGLRKIINKRCQTLNPQNLNPTLDEKRE